MSDRPDALAKWTDRIPESYRDKGWRVWAIAHGHTNTGEEVFAASLQNDMKPEPNGYYTCHGRTEDEAVDRAIGVLLEELGK